MGSNLRDLRVFDLEIWFPQTPCANAEAKAQAFGQSLWRRTISQIFSQISQKDFKYFDAIKGLLMWAPICEICVYLIREISGKRLFSDPLVFASCCTVLRSNDLTIFSSYFHAISPTLCRRKHGE